MCRWARIDDPRSCGFSARANICDVKGAPGAPNCLDADQAAAIDEIWAGPTNEYGQRVWYPFDKGIALGGGRGGFGGFAAIPGSTAQVMSYNHGDLTISTDLLLVDAAAIKAAGNPPGAVTYAQEAALGSKAVDDLMETQSVDLSKAKNHGAKIIMWQGAADPAIRWRDSVDYYRRVATFFGRGKRTSPRYSRGFATTMRRVLATAAEGKVRRPWMCLETSLIGSRTARLRIVFWRRAGV